MSEPSAITIDGLGNPSPSHCRFESKCLLCQEIWDVDALSSRLGLYLTRGEKVLFEGQNFILMPDISPLVPGHSLIVTKDHVPSLAELPDRLYDELEEICQCAVGQLRSSRGSSDRLAVVYFEHGGFAGQRGSGDCVNHAHLHIVPVAPLAAPPPLRDWLEEYGDVFEIEKLRDISTTVRSRGKGYLFCEDEKGRRLLAPDLERPVPCQHMRQMLANHLGVREWNWKGVLSQHRVARKVDGQ